MAQIRVGGRCQAGIYRTHDGNDPLYVRLPIGTEMDAPQDGPYFRVPRKHFDALLGTLVKKYGKIDLTTEFVEIVRCDKRCVDAKGHECVCVCSGINHGGKLKNLYTTNVGENTLIAHGLRRISRTVTAKSKWETRGRQDL